MLKIKTQPSLVGTHDAVSGDYLKFCSTYVLLRMIQVDSMFIDTINQADANTDASQTRQLSGASDMLMICLVPEGM